MTTDLQRVCLDVLTEKYAKGEEKTLPGPTMADAIRRRVASALACCETEPRLFEEDFLHALRSGFIPGG